MSILIYIIGDYGSIPQILCHPRCITRYSGIFLSKRSFLPDKREQNPNSVYSAGQASGRTVRYEWAAHASAACRWGYASRIPMVKGRCGAYLQRFGQGGWSAAEPFPWGLWYYRGQFFYLRFFRGGILQPDRQAAPTLRKAVSWPGAVLADPHWHYGHRPVHWTRAGLFLP